jgi:hypothetical protein
MCAASVNKRPAFSPCFLTSHEFDMIRLLSFLLWHLCNTALEKLSISEAKESDEENGLKVRAVSAAEIREDA